MIDSHAHLKHGDAARTEFPAKTIVDIMDHTGVDRSIVFAMSTTTRRSIEMAEAAVKEYPRRLIPYLYALPSYERPVLAEIESAFKGRLFRGIKVHAGEAAIAEYLIDPLLALASRLGAPCLVDAAGRSGEARRIAGKFPECKLIFAHMGRYASTDGKLVDSFIALAEEFPNVYLDLSAVALVPKIAEAVRRAGAGKLIWGTDGPYANPDLVTYVRRERAKVEESPISEADKRGILGGNIARMLTLA